MRVNTKLIIFLIIIGAFVLRIVNLASVPPSLNWDEVSHGYNAYSILKTGKDEWGTVYPTIFRAYGDYKLPVYIYVTSISEALFGLNALAVRLPSVIAGTLGVLFTYLLVERISKKKNLALLAAFLMAIEPWSLFVSRIAVEANLALFLTISGFYFLIVGIEEKSKKVILAAVLLGLSVWTYNSARIFVPMNLIIITLIYKKQISKKLFLWFGAILAIFFIPMFWQLAHPIGTARYEEVKILDQGTINKIEESRNSSSFSPLITKLVFNKYTVFGEEFVKNYFSYFSPEFLFTNGGSQYQFSLPNNGILYLVDIPFYILGIVYVLKNLKKDKFCQIAAAWLLLAPIAGSLTRESPHVLRDVIALPIPMVLIAAGIVWFMKKKWGMIALFIYFLILAASLEGYMTKFFNDYRRDYSWAWQYGYEQVVDYAKQNYNNFNKIIVTKKYGEPHEFFLFFWPWNPESYLRDSNLNRFYQSNWYWVDGFDKFYFVNDWQVKDLVTESKRKIDCKNVKCLLISSPDNFPKGFKKLETIKFLDGKPAFQLYEN